MDCTMHDESTLRAFLIEGPWKTTANLSWQQMVAAWSRFRDAPGARNVVGYRPN